MNLSSIKEKLAQLPKEPGVYFYYDQKGELIYIGKATDLKNRVSSYFRNYANPRINANPRIANDDEGQIFSRPIETMIHEVEDIRVEQTDSVLEALILESNLIKNHQPKYNVLGKDDKSFSYFVITKEEFPRVLIIHYTDLLKISNFKFKITNQYQISNDKIINKKFKYKDIKIGKYFGPYVSKYQMEIALKIIRRIFPFHAMSQKSEKGCLDFQIGKCPGPYAGAISKDDYAKNIRGIRMILEGKKKGLVKTLEKEMAASAKKEEFEKAAELRNKIFALNHIRDIALMNREYDEDKLQITNDKFQTNFKSQNSKFRIEAYDISNISGQHAVGSMVVFENGKPNKAEYRKFKIKTVKGSNDVGMMQEVLLRRFNNDWPTPDLVLLDGGLGHLNMGEKLLHEELGLDVVIAGVAKGPTRKKLDVRYDANLRINANPQIANIFKDNNLLKSIMDEAHRFAITYHRKVRKKSLLN